jgi:hypothetical protein
VKAGAKPDAVCPTSNDTAALEAKVDAFVADLVADLDTTAAANKCVAGKTKCAATKTGALLGCRAKALGKGIAVDVACLAKAKSKFDGAAEPAKGCFEKLRPRVKKRAQNAVCPTSDDTAAIEARSTRSSPTSSATSSPRAGARDPPDAHRHAEAADGRDARGMWRRQHPGRRSVKPAIRTLRAAWPDFIAL